jgi:hypothetical protein
VGPQGAQGPQGPAGPTGSPGTSYWSDQAGFVRATADAEIPTDVALRFGAASENSDPVSFRRSNLASDQTRLRLEVGDNLSNDDYFEIFAGGDYRHRFFNSGNYESTGVVRATGLSLKGSGNIEWDENQWGGTGDDAYIRYVGQGGENTQLQIGIGNDTDDDIVLQATGPITLSGSTTAVTSGLTVAGEIAVSAAVVRTGCPAGYSAPANTTQFCMSDWRSPTQYRNAVIDCLDEGSHVCTYEDWTYAWIRSGSNQGIASGDWIGNMVADDTVLCCNNTGDSTNFEGHCSKSESRWYKCCKGPAQ